MLRSRLEAHLRAPSLPKRAPSTRLQILTRGLAVHSNLPPPTPTPSSSAPAPAAPPNPLLSPTLQRYAPRLYAVSARTGVPLSSLAVSFLILHELTAIIPLVLLFWLFQVLGTGAAFVNWIKDISEPSSSAATVDEEREKGWSWKKTVAGWIEEGEKRVERVGRRYGILGYEKSTSKSAAQETGETPKPERSLTRSGAGAAGGVTNAIAAYVVVKALLPVRIGVSIAAAPAFARFALEPFRRLGLRLGGRRKPAP